MNFFALIVDNRFMPHETMQNIDNRILLCYFAGVAEPARLGNNRVSMQRLPRFHKKAVMKVAHNNGVDIVIECSGDLVGSGG